MVDSNRILAGVLPLRQEINGKTKPLVEWKTLNINMLSLAKPIFSACVMAIFVNSLATI